MRMNWTGFKSLCQDKQINYLEYYLCRFFYLGLNISILQIPNWKIKDPLWPSSVWACANKRCGQRICYFAQRPGLSMLSVSKHAETWAQSLRFMDRITWWIVRWGLQGADPRARITYVASDSSFHANHSSFAWSRPKQGWGSVRIIRRKSWVPDVAQP